MLGLFGIPAPTTGMTRSVLALFSGELSVSLRWNPFTLPVIFLFVYSLVIAGGNLCFRRDANLPRSLVLGWIICLAGAWFFKLWQGPDFW